MYRSKAKVAGRTKSARVEKKRRAKKKLRGKRKRKKQRERERENVSGARCSDNALNTVPSGKRCRTGQGG